MDELLTISPGMSTTRGKNIASVVSRWGKRLLGFIRQRVGNEADAEDILQDVWYQLTTTVDTEPIEQMSGWLFTVARNKITDRHRKKRPESLDLLMEAGESWAAGEIAGAREGGPNFAGILLDDN